MAHVVKVEIDPGTGEGFVPIPDAVLAELGWSEGVDLDVRFYPETRSLVVTGPAPGATS